jgi:hypothetical protein
MHAKIGTFLQLFVGNTSDGTEETIWMHERSNRHSKINMEFCTSYLILQWLSNQNCEEWFMWQICLHSFSERIVVELDDTGNS